MEADDPRVSFLSSLSPEDVKEMRSVYRVLAEEGGRLFYPKEGDSDDLSTHFAPLQRLGLLEGPEDNSKWVVLHQASNVLPLLDRLAGAVEQSGPTKEAQFTEILSLMDKERLPALESEADCPKEPQDSGNSAAQTVPSAPASGASGIPDQTKSTEKRRPYGSTFRHVPFCSFALKRYLGPVLEDKRSGLERLTEAAASMSSVEQEERGGRVTLPTAGSWSWENYSAPSAAGHKRPVQSHEEEAAAEKEGEVEEEAPALKRRTPASRESHDTPGAPRARRRASADSQPSPAPSKERADPPAAAQEPERSHSHPRALTSHQQALVASMVGVAGERRRGLCESFVREMHQFTFKEDVLERLRALRLPSRPILSKLESDVLDALAVAAERSEKAMRLACWLAKKQHSGLPVFVLNVDSIFDALARMERAEFAGALQRAVSEDRAPYILRRLRDSLHMVFASPAPAGSFF